MWPPACSPPGNVSPPSRRGGACPSRWFPEGFHFARRISPCGAAHRVIAPYGRHGPQAAGGSESRPYNVSGGSQQKRTTGARCAPLRRLKEITAEENGILRTAHRQNQQKPPQLFPVLYSNISQKFSFVTIMSQYYGFVTLRPNPLTGGLH